MNGNPGLSGEAVKAESARAVTCPHCGRPLVLAVGASAFLTTKEAKQ